MQETQQVLNGVVAGFAMLIHGIREERRTYDTAKQMKEGSRRLRATWDHQGELPAPIEYRILLKTEVGDEEEVDLQQYGVPGLRKGNAVHKIICKCGTSFWIMGKASDFVGMLPFVCDDCLN